MAKVRVLLSIDRFYEPADEIEFRKFLWEIGYDASDQSFSSSSMKPQQFIKLIRLLGIEKDDELEIRIEGRPDAN